MVPLVEITFFSRVVQVSGLSEIIQWTENNVDFVKGEDPIKAFNDIDKMFAKDNRSALADILGAQQGDFIEYIETKTETTREDVEINELEMLVRSLFG